MCVERGARLETPGVREEHAHGNRRLVRRVELRDVAGHRAVEVECARLLEHHRQRRGRDHLGERGEIVQRAGVHTGRAVRIAQSTVAPQMHEAAESAHGHRSPRRRAFSKRYANDAVEPSGEGGVHPHR